MTNGTREAAEALVLALRTEYVALTEMATQRQEAAIAIEKMLTISGNGEPHTNGHARVPRGTLVGAIEAFLKFKGRKGAHATEIAQAIGRPYNNVYVAAAQSPRFRKVGEAQFALAKGH